MMLYALLSFLSSIEILLHVYVHLRMNEMLPKI
jgi:hypothetical protein